MGEKITKVSFLMTPVKKTLKKTKISEDTEYLTWAMSLYNSIPINRKYTFFFSSIILF